MYDALLFVEIQLIIVSDEIKYIPRHGGAAHPALRLSLSFLDPKDGLRAAQRTSPQRQGRTQRSLLECPTMYEAVRPFLEGLQNADPTQYPMARYLRGENPSTDIALPEYTMAPNFKWDLSVLLKDDASISKCEMSAANRLSVKDARLQLRSHGKLDPRYEII